MHITHPRIQRMQHNGKHCNLHSKKHPKQTLTLFNWKGKESLSLYDSQAPAWPRYQEAAAFRESSAARQVGFNLAPPLNSCVNLHEPPTPLM